MRDSVALTHDSNECFASFEILRLSDGNVLHGDGATFLVEDACLDAEGQRQAESTERDCKTPSASWGRSCHGSTCLLTL